MIGAVVGTLFAGVIAVVVVLLIADAAGDRELLQAVWTAIRLRVRHGRVRR
jgi:hypothetical protein